MYIIPYDCLLSAYCVCLVICMSLPIKEMYMTSMNVECIFLTSSDTYFVIQSCVNGSSEISVDC